ncbi:MAG: response regulator [bacterium]
MAEEKTILIVDDDAEIRDYFSTFLQDNGYKTLTAQDGQEALEKVRSEPPDLILLDIMMPNKTGTDFYRRFHMDKELSSIPIIVVSGAAGKHLAVPKPSAIIDKPVDTKKLLDEVKRVLNVE